MDMRDYLFGGTTRQMVYKSLDANTLRSRVFSNNLANVTTHGYQRKEVNFEDQLKDALKIKVKGKITNEEHIEISKKAALKTVKPMAFESTDPTLPGEINNVDIDMEMAKLAENQLQYNFNIKFAGFSKFLSAISGQASQQ